MKKLILLIILLIPFKVFSLTYPELSAKSVVLYDLTDEKIMYEKNPDEKSAIASLTKTMTVITAIEEIKDLNEKVTIKQEVLDKVNKEASTSGLKAGDIVTYEDLLYAVILPSGADAALSIAYSLYETEAEFVEKMNELAKRIGMKNSQFRNVHGLDRSGHYSSASDLRILLEYALKNQTFKKVYTTKEYKLSNGLKVSSTLVISTNEDKETQYNTNKILGSKTGSTTSAGKCISVLFKYKKHEFLLVTLGSNPEVSSIIHIKDALEMIDFINKNFNKHLILKEGTTIKNVKSNNQLITYEIKIPKDIYLFLPNDYDQNKITYEYNEIKNKKGTITFFYDNQKIHSEEINLDTEIQNKNKIMLIPIMVILISSLIIKYNSIKSH